MKQAIVLLWIAAVCCCQLPSCPNGNLAGDMFSGSVTLGLVDPLSAPNVVLVSEDLYSYNYVLPLPFRKAPSVAISVSDFHSAYLTSFSYSVRYLNNQNRQNLTFLIRLDQRLASWTKLTFNFLSQIRDDILTFGYDLAPRLLVSDQQNKTETWLIPYLEPWVDAGESKVAVYINGFDLYSRSASYPNNSFELKIVNAKIGAAGLVITANCSSTTRVQKIYFSFVIMNSKTSVQTVAFLNQNTSSGESKYLISTNGLQLSTGSALAAADMASFKSLLGLSSFSIDNNSTLGRSFSIEFSSATAEVMVNTTGSNFTYLANSYLFLKGEDCAGCLGYSLFDSARNACVAFCPSNTFLELGQCKYCPAGQHLSSTGCVSCQANEEWDGTVCKCITGFYRNVNGLCDLCPAGTTFVNGKCQCPYLGQYFDELSKTCNCPPQMYVVSGKCQQCDAGKYWDGKACVDICSKFINMKWDGFNCVCKDGFALSAPYTCSCNGNIDSDGNCLQCLVPNTFWNGIECACKTGYKKSTTGTCVLDTLTPTYPTYPTYPSYPTYPGYPSYPSYMFPSAPATSGLLSIQGAIMSGLNTLSLSLKLNGLPATLLQNGACAMCSSIFVVQTSLPNTFKSTIQYNGVSSVDSQSLFSVTLQFDYFPTQNFNIFVKVNPTFSTYFGTTDISQSVAKYVDLRLLSTSGSGNNMRKDSLK